MNWQTKAKNALDLSIGSPKLHYDELLGVRQQIRNYLAHECFFSSRKRLSTFTPARSCSCNPDRITLVLTH